MGNNLPPNIGARERPFGASGPGAHQHLFSASTMDSAGTGSHYGSLGDSREETKGNSAGAGLGHGEMTLQPAFSNGGGDGGALASGNDSSAAGAGSAASLGGVTAAAGGGVGAVPPTSNASGGQPI